MVRCPNCRTKVDPSFITHCPECSTALAAETSDAETSQPRPRSRIGGWLGGTAIRVLIGLLIFGGVSAYRAINSADRDDTGTVVGSGDAFWDDVQLGDCAMMPPDGEVESLDLVPCEEAHHLEVFLITSHPADDYPGDEALSDWAGEACHRGFGLYVGRSYEEATELDFTYFSPTSSGWRSGDREVVCMVGDTDGGILSGSVSGSA